LWSVHRGCTGLEQVFRKVKGVASQVRYLLKVAIKKVSVCNYVCMLVCMWLWSAQPCVSPGVAKSSTSFSWVKGGNATCVG